MAFSGRFLLILAVMVSTVHVARAQVGLGVGSSGLAVKTAPDGKFGFIGRLNFNVGSNNIIVPQLNLIRRFVNEEKAKFYGGVGVTSTMNLDGFDPVNSLGLRVPLGIEYFPFETKPFSIGAEGGLTFNAGERYGIVGFTSLVELTFYLGGPKKE